MAQPLPSQVPLSSPPPRQPPDDLTSWSEVAVCDRLFGFYSGAFAEADCARQAARLQWLCWRAYLNHLGVQGRAAREALARILMETRLDPALIDRADAAVVDELTDLVLHKYRRAPEQAKVYISALVAAATQMALGRAS